MQFGFGLLQVSLICSSARSICASALSLSRLDMGTRSFLFLFYFYFTILNSLIGSLCLLHLLYHCYNGYTSQVQNINKSIYTTWYKCIIWPISKFYYIFFLESTLKSYPLLGQLFKGNLIGFWLSDWIKSWKWVVQKGKKDSEIQLDYRIQS